MNLSANMIFNIFKNFLQEKQARETDFCMMDVWDHFSLLIVNE